MPGTAALMLVALHATAAVVGFGFGPVVPAWPVPPAPEAPAPAPTPTLSSEAPASPAPPGPAVRGFLPIRYVETSEPAVAITFDACATRTHLASFDRNVFDVVKREGIPITIFVSGRWVEAHGDVMTELAGDPLVEFGDHSYDHPHMSHLPVARIVEEIDQTEAALARYGKRSVAFRPPFGEWSHRLVYVVQDLRLPTVTWDVVSGDPSARTTTDGMIRNVLGKARPGSIIIFHINGRGWKTAEALPAILRGLRERGFRVVPLSALMASASSRVTARPTPGAPPPTPPNPVVAPIPIAPGDTPPPVVPLRAATLPPPLPPAGHAAP
jgi:peptidoglycan/xylan/chitin deacetylase (PgdA/CDA1 family)